MLDGRNIPSGNIDLLAVVTLILIIIIRFSPFVFQGTPINTDAWRNYHPWRMDYSETEIKHVGYDNNLEYSIWNPLVKKQISEGFFPHWNPYSFCGAPLYANHLVPVFHLPYALALLFPGNIVTTAYAFFMALTGTLFFYWFLRNWKFSVYVSFFGGLVFFLSGWQQYCVLTEVVSLIWVPAILLFHDRFLNSNSFTDAFLGAFCVSQLLIASYPLHVAHFVYVMIIYCLWRRFHPDFTWKASIQRWVLAVLIFIVAGTLISGVQNYPTCMYMKESNRDFTSVKKYLYTGGEVISRGKAHFEKHGRKINLATLTNVAWFQVLEKTILVIPTHGKYLHFSRLFAGPITVLLALIAVFIGHRRYRVLKFCFLFFGFIFIFPHVYPILARIIPGWTISTGFPFEVFFLLLFFMAALGLDTLLKIERFSTTIMILLFAIVVLSIVFCIQSPMSALDSPLRVYRWNSILDVWFISLYFLVTFLILIIIGLKATGYKVSSELGMTGLVLFMVSGFLCHMYIYPYFADHSPLPFNNRVQGVIDTCKNGRIVRYYRDDFDFTNPDHQDFMFPPNIPVKFQVMDVFGYDSFMMGNYFNFLERVAPQTVLLDKAIFTLNDIEQLNKSGLLVQATGARYCLSKDTTILEDKLGSPVFDNGIQIYRIGSDEYPYVRFFSRYSLVEDFNSDPENVDFTSAVIMDRQPVLPDGSLLKSSEGLTTGDAKLVKINRTYSTLEINFYAPSDCILYISDTYHSKWRAILDGKNINVIQANLAFRAVTAPEGKHTLFMWYDGIDVVIGCWISFTGFVIALLAAIMDRKLSKLKEN